MQQSTTPIEKHTVANRAIFVKRDDLYGKPPAPPVAKLRGLEVLVRRLSSDGQELIGCFEARVSSIGQGVAAVCSGNHKLSCIVAYPEIRGAVLSPSLTSAKELGV